MIDTRSCTDFPDPDAMDEYNELHDPLREKEWKAFREERRREQAQEVAAELRDVLIDIAGTTDV